MSTSAQQSAQQLKKYLTNLLPDRYRQNYLNSNLARELNSLGFPTPEIFDDAVVVFREFFTEISHPNIMSFGWSRGPIVFENIFFAIKKFGERLRSFRRILIWTCEQYCQYEALFAVMCEALHHPVDYYDRFNSQNRRDFLLKGMMMVRIEQRRRFPPGPNCKLTYLFHFSLDDILGMMKRKNGMHDHADTRSHMEKSLRIYNSYWNDKYSGPIRRLLQAKPNFFSKWRDQLETFLRKVRIDYKERFWLDLMEDMSTNFWNALNEAGINNGAKSWILYWYLRYRYNLNFEPQDRESFNDLMTRIVQHGEMAFPFKDPPRLVKKNNFCFFPILEAALEWESVPTSDLLEICYRSHIKSQYGQVPSQCVLSASVRRKLYEVKIAKKAASTLSRFAKVQCVANVSERLQNFVKDLSCYECPLCFEDLSSVSIGVIQPCGHIHCKVCFDQIGTKCSYCRAKFIQSDCKSVGTFLSKSNPKFFFTRVNSDKKAAITVIIKWWAMKRRTVA